MMKLQRTAVLRLIGAKESDKLLRSFREGSLAMAMLISLELGSRLRKRVLRAWSCIH